MICNHIRYTEVEEKKTEEHRKENSLYTAHIRMGWKK